VARGDIMVNINARAPKAAPYHVGPLRAAAPANSPGSIMAQDRMTMLVRRIGARRRRSAASCGGGGLHLLQVSTLPLVISALADLQLVVPGRLLVALISALSVRVTPAGDWTSVVPTGWEGAAVCVSAGALLCAKALPARLSEINPMQIVRRLMTQSSHGRFDSS